MICILTHNSQRRYDHWVTPLWGAAAPHWFLTCQSHTLYTSFPPNFLFMFFPVLTALFFLTLHSSPCPLSFLWRYSRLISVSFCVCVCVSGWCTCMEALTAWCSAMCWGSPLRAALLSLSSWTVWRLCPAWSVCGTPLPPPVCPGTQRHPMTPRAWETPAVPEGVSDRNKEDVCFLGVSRTVQSFLSCNFYHRMSGIVCDSVWIYPLHLTAFMWDPVNVLI